MSASLDSNISLKSEAMDQNVNQFYEEFIDGTGHWFLCKYQECGELETTEKDIIEHLRQHFKADEIPENLIHLNLSKSFSDESNEPGIDCIDLAIDEDMNHIIKSEPIDDFNGHSNGSINIDNNGVNELENLWEKWFDIQPDGKMKCLFSQDCHFECSLRMKAKVHINKHLADLKSGQNVSGIQTGIIPQDHEFWNQFIADNLPLQSTSREPVAKDSPKTPVVKRGRGRPKSTNVTPTVSASKPELRSATKTTPLTEPPESTPSHNLVDIHFNQNDALLSLKGMASVKKLDQYIRCEVVNNCKYFCCNYNNSCQFKSKRSQETALHVHCTHLNFFLRCVQPGCDRIFRTPGSWREHQKNHICNFGLYGYQRGVTGKCRNEYLKQFQEKIIIEGNQKAYRCLWKDCGFTTKHRTGVKRNRDSVHIHNNHVCEYRKTKLWKTRLLDLMQNNSYMTDIAIPTKQSAGYKRVHVCHRPECGAHFGTEADLKKHEAVCGSKSAKNGPNLRSKGDRTANAIQMSVINAFNGSQIPQTIDRRSSKRIEQMVEQQTTKTRRQSIGNVSQNLNGSEVLRAQCQPYIEVKPYEGVDYYLCKASNCKFVTKNADKINDHIQSSHLLADKRSAITIEVQAVNTRKRSTSTDINDNSKKLRSDPQSTSQNIGQSFRSGLNQNQTKSSDNMSFIEKYKDFIEIKSIDSEPHYFCKYSDKMCRFYSNSAQEIEEHIRQTHIVFRCDVKDCDREFKTQNLLDIHRRNHICGFGIRGMKASGVCSLDNVRKYRREVVVDGRYQYECKSCGYVSESKTTVLSHIHNRHIHPQPPPDD